MKIKWFINIYIILILAGETCVCAVGEKETSDSTERHKPTGPNVLVSAFPGAEGAGAMTPGGRGGKVIEVTNLRDRGSGSLRSAIDARGPRIVVFRVGGVIELRSPLRIENPYITIAGQTAPGGGIILKGTDEGGGKMIVIRDTHDVIIRYLRIRSGKHGEPGHGQVNIAIDWGAHDVIIDHVSVSWTLDENISIHRNIPDDADPESWPHIYNVTVQRSIIAEGLYPHSTGIQIGGEFAVEGWRGVHDLSIHHNLFVSNSHRNPGIGSTGTRVINNVVYNWGSKLGSTWTGTIADWIGSYFKPGPLSAPDSLIVHNAFPKHHPEVRWPAPSIYVAGNVSPPLYPDPEADNWVLYRIHYSDAPIPADFRRTRPLSRDPIPVTIQSAYEAYPSVLSDVGANARLDSKGNRVSNADAVDLRLLSNVRNGTGSRGETHGMQYKTHIAHEDEAGGYAQIDAGKPFADSDHDGMPDEWEINTGLLDPEVDDSAGYSLDSNYTNIEVYINGQ